MNKFSTCNKREAPKETKNEIHRNNSASLKDLCAEDKQRVANLINELARVGEEKNKVAQALNNEKLQFEQQMKNLVEQQERILQERQGTRVAIVQQQLWECQNLLSQYQRIVSTQQDVLNTQFSEPDQDLPGDGSIVVNPDHASHETNGQQHQHTRGSQRYAVSPKQVMNVRPKDVPRLPLSDQSGQPDDGQGSRRSSTPDIPSDSHQSADREMTPRGTRKIRVPTVVKSGSDRPFTAYIDGLIASEQEASQHLPNSPHHQQEDNGNRRANRSGEGSTTITSVTQEKASSARTGPLYEPVLSSTHQSDALSTSQHSRTRAGEFKPLLPDTSPRSSLQSIGTHPLDEFSHRLQEVQDSDQGDAYSTHHGGGAPHPALHRYPQEPYHTSIELGTRSSTQQHHPGSRVTFHEELHLLSQPLPPGGLHYPAHQLSDDDFVSYYKSMSAEERQRHLQTQKAALLSEQQRLRKVLEDQEQLLHSKQHQLHMQQEVQHRRLQHFEQTGAFPSEHDQQPTLKQPSDSAFAVTVPVGHAQCSDVVDVHPQEYDHLESHSDGCQPPPMALSHQDPYRLCSKVSIETQTHPHLKGVHNLQYNGDGGVSVAMAQSSIDADHVFPGLQCNGPEISQEEISAVTESFENMLFLQKHGIDVPDIRRDGKKKVCSLPARAARPSMGGHSSGQQPGARSEVETMDDLLGNSWSSSSDVIDRDGKKMVRKTARHRSSPQKLNDGEYAARLLELVDDVEHSHLARHHNHHPPPSRAYTAGQGFPRFDPTQEEPGVADGQDEEDADESRILEEVFFVM